MIAVALALSLLAAGPRTAPEITIPVAVEVSSACCKATGHGYTPRPAAKNAHTTYTPRVKAQQRASSANAQARVGHGYTPRPKRAAAAPAKAPTSATVAWPTPPKTKPLYTTVRVH